MKDEFDKFVDDLQQQIIDDTLKDYGEKAVDHWLNPRNTNPVRNPDGYAKIKGNCGDTIEIALKVTNDLISEIYFTTDGCGSSGMCGSVVTEMAKNKTLAEARRINEAVVLEFIGGMPEEEEHCANLASITLQAAIDDYENKS